MLAKVVRFLCRSAVVALTLGIVLSAAGLFWYSKMIDATGPHQQDVIVVIDSGSGHKILRHALYQAGVLHHIYHYDVARLLAGSGFVPKAGEFLLPAKANLSEVLSILHKGHGHQRRLTIVEGLRSADVVKLINSMPNLVGAIKPLPEEGVLRPETYFYTHGTQRQALINRMEETQEITLAEAWVGREKGLPYENSQDALIMASIIEKEASIDSDRHLVAAVLVNRLRKGMRLQSDPTVLYEASESPLTPTPITKTDLKTKTPWNTYAMSGLPKTPICNPGQASIMAALHPAKSDYLYFVSDGSGRLRFAKTLDEHNRNVRLFRRYEAAAKKGMGK